MSRVIKDVTAGACISMQSSPSGFLAPTGTDSRNIRYVSPVLPTVTVWASGGAEHLAGFGTNSAHLCKLHIHVDLNRVPPCSAGCPACQRSSEHVVLMQCLKYLLHLVCFLYKMIFKKIFLRNRLFLNRLNFYWGIWFCKYLKKLKFFHSW